MDDHELYKMITKISCLLLLFSCGIVLIIFKEKLYALSILLGWILCHLGFLFIIYMTEHDSLTGNVKNKFTGAYIFRYIVYFVVMFIGAKQGLNILCMLIGFVCLNIAIKVSAFLTREEDD